MKNVDKICSVCEESDIGVWSFTSASLLDYIDSKEYYVIVPKSQLKLFRKKTPTKFFVVSEEEFIGGFSENLRKYISKNDSSFGWYLQQFIKLSFLNEMSSNDLLLIWDADTVPIRKIEFKIGDRYKFFIGSEHHTPYFDTCQKLLGYGKQVPFSWIAQCLPAPGLWIKNFIKTIENRHSKHWTKCILECIEFQTLSFSEYETLGSFFFKEYPNEILIDQGKWQRYGNGIIGSPRAIKYTKRLLSLRYNYMAFEKWDKPFSYFK